jgi:glucose-1-phosphate adenylyltransferase
MFTHMEELMAIIMAGGRGERLSVLSQERAKPAIPFAGRYRIIDFVLSNCVNSGIHKVIVLTQYQPTSITEHIGVGTPWGLVPPDRGIRMLQPFRAPERGRDWYRGTADAVRQNLESIEEEKVKDVLILSGDHVYKIDYTPMLKAHRANNADVTLAVTRIPQEELHRFGTVSTNKRGRVINFQEKVKRPESNLVSMGVYLFKKKLLRQYLEANSGDDFGRHIFPEMVGKKGIYTYTFEGYWRDIGTVASYWQANMDMISMPQTFLYDTSWPIHTKEFEQPPSRISDTANVVDCLLSGGCVIQGHVEHCVISPGVKIARGAVVRDSIIMHGSHIGRDSVVDRAILDEGVAVEENCHIGYGSDYLNNRQRPRILSAGLTLISKHTKIPAGVTIGRNVTV